MLARMKSGLYFAGSGSIERNGSGTGVGKVKGKKRIGAWREIWMVSGLFERLSGIVLTWAAIGGILR